MYKSLGLILPVLFLASALEDDRQDAHATFIELCNIYGFRAENHTVTTADGYKLLLFRIPGKLGEEVEEANGKPVAFFQHGLIDLADSWITNDADKAPGFLMANAGYDVWFGNSRGNKYSKAHTTLDPSSHAFWKFSYQHMAQYDVPANVNFILSYTGQTKLVYIGHSQGTSQIFAQLAEHPEFMQKLHIVIALAPVGSVKHLNNGLLQILKSVDLFKALSLVGLDQFLPSFDSSSLFYTICSNLNLICSSGVEFFADMEVSQDNTDRFPVNLAHEPGGTSIMDMEHWQQNLNWSPQGFKKFDYGQTTNMQVYGQPTPPDYDLTRVPGPIAFFFGTEDRLSTPEDGDWLLSQIPKSSQAYVKRDLAAGHLTFLWGLDMSFFNTVIALANQYSGNNSVITK